MSIVTYFVPLVEVLAIYLLRVSANYPKKFIESRIHSEIKNHMLIQKSPNKRKYPKQIQISGKQKFFIKILLLNSQNISSSIIKYLISKISKGFLYASI